MPLASSVWYLWGGLLGLLWLICLLCRRPDLEERPQGHALHRVPGAHSVDRRSHVEQACPVAAGHEAVGMPQPGKHQAYGPSDPCAEQSMPRGACLAQRRLQLCLERGEPFVEPKENSTGLLLARGASFCFLGCFTVLIGVHEH